MWCVIDLRKVQNDMVRMVHNGQEGVKMKNMFFLFALVFAFSLVYIQACDISLGLNALGLNEPQREIVRIVNLNPITEETPTLILYNGTTRATRGGAVMTCTQRHAI